MTKPEEAPVLLIIFNRPDTLQVVFDVIRKAKPSKLYVSADGPRKGNVSDNINCEKAREITKNVDWKCETHYRFLEENLGCGWGPASAISWAFENEDRLIILEDDCVPSIAFFPYCNYLLEKYLVDTRIWFVSGRSDDTDPSFFQNVDYMFSHYGHSWGWATWRRCWQHFDIEMKNFPEYIKYGGAKNVFFSRREGELYNRTYKKLFIDKNLYTHVWDFQFGHSIMSNGGLAIVPAKNLIENIGLSGTHSSGINKYCELKAEEDFIIKNEPEFVLANREFDLYHFKNHISKTMRQPSFYKTIFGLPGRIIRKGLKIAGLR
jgi:hypothetical protein